MSNTIINFIKSNPGFQTVLLTLIIIGLVFVLKYYLVSAIKKAGEIKSKHDYKSLLASVEKAISESKTVGNIQAKLNNLSDLINIEETITTALKEIDIKYWRKKQLEDLKREKLELLMMELDKDMELINESYNTTSILGQKYTVNALVNLYFHDLIEVLNEYLKQRRLVKENIIYLKQLYNDKVQISQNVSDKYKSEYYKLQIKYQQFFECISTESKKLEHVNQIENKYR